MIEAGDMFGRLAQLDEYVKSANLDPFYQGLLDCSVDASAELKNREFKIHALVINSDYSEYKKLNRAATIAANDLAMQRRECMMRALNLREDIEEVYITMFGGPGDGN